MNDNKTILIFTAQFGAGHTSVANAIKDYILESNSTHTVMIKNFIDVSIPQVNDFMVNMYESHTKYVPGLYNYYYYFKKSFGSKFDISLKLLSPNLSTYILEVMPDLIICTFPLAAACVYEFKKKYPDIDIPNLTVITDVVDSLEWVFPNTSMYFVPSNDIRDSFIDRGIDVERIKVTGIPINKKFHADSKIIHDKKYRLLIMGGGRGLFDVDKDFFYWIDEFISEYDNCLDVTIVTGSNKKLFEELTQKKPLLNINVLGYVNNLYDLVKSYDLIITKPGGATLFESIHSQTPIIVKLPKIGQEIENAKFIMDNGLGIIYYDEKDLKTIISSLPDGNFDNIIEYIQSNITYFKQSIHPEKIYDYILELINNKN